MVRGMRVSTQPSRCGRCWRSVSEIGPAPRTPRQTPPQAYFVTTRTGPMKPLACSLLAAALALTCRASHAEVGPTPPVEIRDSTDAWKLSVSFDRQRFMGLFATQEVLGSTHEPDRE